MPRRAPRDETATANYRFCWVGRPAGLADGLALIGKRYGTGGSAIRPCRFAPRDGCAVPMVPPFPHARRKGFGQRVLQVQVVTAFVRPSSFACRSVPLGLPRIECQIVLAALTFFKHPSRRGYRGRGGQTSMSPQGPILRERRRDRCRIGSAVARCRSTSGCVIAEPLLM
jgi:hypothetical protein